MQFTPEGNDRIATSYEIAAGRLRIAREQTLDRMARFLLYRAARRYERAAIWHRDRAAYDRRQHAQKSES